MVLLFLVIIAAGFVLTKNVESFSVYGGVLQKKITNRVDSENDLEEHKKYATLNINN